MGLINMYIYNFVLSIITSIAIDRCLTFPVQICYTEETVFRIMEQKLIKLNSIKKKKIKIYH